MATSSENEIPISKDWLKRKEAGVSFQETAEVVVVLTRKVQEHGTGEQFENTTKQRTLADNNRAAQRTPPITWNICVDGRPLWLRTTTCECKGMVRGAYAPSTDQTAKLLLAS